jgi:hypothetical protein
MKVCKRCFREFDETADAFDASPAEELGGLFITCMGKDETQHICPECKEELGMMNLLGFKE